MREEPAGGENMPIVFSWSTMDFIKKPFTEFYFSAAVFGAMAMVAWGIYNRSFVTVITFIVLAAAVILILNEEPKKVDVKISENGIDINDEHFKFSEFRSFKITNADEMPALILKHRKSLSLIQTIYLENEPVNDLEIFLGLYIERDEDVKEA